MRAAEARDIPWLRLNDHEPVQFGHGKYQKRIQATVTSETRHIAVEIASDKEETEPASSATSACRCRSSASSAPPRSAVEAANAHRLPGRGQAARRATTAAASRSDLTTDDEVARRVRRRARASARSVVVETFIDGHDHRLLVVNGELVAVGQARCPGTSSATASSTIAELVDDREPATRAAASATRRC